MTARSDAPDADEGGSRSTDDRSEAVAAFGESTTRSIDSENTRADEVPDPDESGDGQSHDRSALRAVRETGHWTGVSALALVLVGVGAIYSSRALLLASAVGVAYVAYASVGAPSASSLTVERELSDPAPAIGDEVTVRTTIRHEGRGFLPDVRVVDGVPPELPVVDGSPRAAAAMRPGGTVDLEYTVVARRGTHSFDPATVLSRSPSAANEREYAVEVPTEIVCRPSLRVSAPVPLRSLLTRYAGRVETDVGGHGLEFHSTREYRRGDPLSRIDWNRRARTGEFTTRQFREERSATVVLLLDLREEAYRRADESGLHAVDHGVAAAGRVFSALLESGDRVGVAALSPIEAWLAPGVGSDHRARARALFAEHPALSPVPPEEPYYAVREMRRLRKRLPRDAQLIVFSPLCDDPIVEIVRRFESHGHPTTVVSPDPTGSETLGERIGRAERAVRISGLRTSGVPVVDWDPADSFESTAAERRWWSR